jgi:hypothetical protein
MAELKPKAAVRRFDVFAEYNRRKAMKDGMKSGKAKGYGLWLAKVVAAQKFGRLPKPTGEKKEGKEKEKPAEERAKRAWLELSGIKQTDKLFDKEIVNRMGKPFYSKVFAPAIKEAFEEEKEYREIRDAIRRGWKPSKDK